VRSRSCRRGPAHATVPRCHGHRRSDPARHEIEHEYDEAHHQRHDDRHEQRTLTKGSVLGARVRQHGAQSGPWHAPRPSGAAGVRGGRLGRWLLNDQPKPTWSSSCSGTGRSLRACVRRATTPRQSHTPSPAAPSSGRHSSCPPCRRPQSRD